MSLKRETVVWGLAGVTAIGGVSYLAATSELLNGTPAPQSPVVHPSLANVKPLITRPTTERCAFDNALDDTALDCVSGASRKSAVTATAIETEMATIHDRLQGINAKTMHKFVKFVEVNGKAVDYNTVDQFFKSYVFTAAGVVYRDDVFLRKPYGQKDNSITSIDVQMHPAGDKRLADYRNVQDGLHSSYEGGVHFATDGLVDATSGYLPNPTDHQLAQDIRVFGQRSDTVLAANEMLVVGPVAQQDYNQAVNLTLASR